MQLPDGWTQAQYEWLSALGKAQDPALLLRQNREWQRPSWVITQLDALRGLTPRDLRQLLPAVRGLIIVADRTSDLEARCYAREKLLTIQLVLFDLNDVSPLMRELERLLPSAAPRRRASSLRVLAELYRTQGNHEHALTLAQRARAAAQTLGDAMLLSQCEYTLASIHYLRGELDEAVPLIQSARRNAKRAGNLRQTADCWLFEGVVRRARGEYDLALQAYRNARPLFEQTNYALGVARAIANMGLVYWTMGLYEDAQLHYREALPRFQQLGAEWDVATCTLNLAILLQNEDDWDEAEALYEDARQRYEKLGDREGVAYCDLNLASAYNDSRQFARAERLAHRAAVLFEQMGNPALTTQARLNKTQALLGQRKPREATQTLEAAQRDLNQLDAPLLTIDHAFLYGDALAQSGRNTEAHRQFQRCLQAIRDMPSLVGVPSEEISQYLKRFQAHTAAIASHYGRKSEWRSAFEACQLGKGNALRLAWQAPRRYAELTRAEQGRLDTLRTRYENALAQQNRARTPAEQRRLRRETDRRLAEWRNYQRELAARYPRLRWRQPDPLRPEQLPLDNETLIVEYALASDWLTLVWARRQGGRVQIGGAIQRVSEEILRGAIRTLLDNIEREAPLETVHRDARRLYDWLIRPLEAQLSGVKRVIVCPDGDLHAAPWAVLRDSQGRYLLERVAIGSCPSASAWAAAEAMARGKRASGRVLTVAVSEFHGAEGDTRARLSPLPGAEREAQAVLRVWGRGAQLLLNQQATRSTTLQRLPEASVLHFATHAVPNLRMPMLSALALWGNNAPQWLYAHEAMQARLNARLVVLSACRTGVGSFTTDGALGLHWAFLAAGCPTVLATLWRLPDDAAPLWTETFHTRYKSGDAPTDALRRACLQLLQNPRYAHPRYWSAWQAFGAR